MDHQLPAALQAALYAASLAIIVFAVVVVRFLSKLDKKLDRVVATVERVESELVPLTRETRLVVDRVRDLAERIHHQWMAVERVAAAVRRWTGRGRGLGGAVVAPLIASSAVRTGVTTFLRTLWTGRRPLTKAKVS